jgi:hypothetical protein
VVFCSGEGSEKLRIDTHDVRCSGILSTIHEDLLVFRHKLFCKFVMLVSRLLSNCPLKQDLYSFDRDLQRFYEVVAGKDLQINHKRVACTLGEGLVERIRGSCPESC